MSERKVLNVRVPCRFKWQKYYPPDFDPSKIKRRKGINKDKQMVIRLMAPFSMRCTRCGEYIYKGKKFNARKETVTDEEYYGIHIFRFYIKCTHCSGEITFKTDPKNADYQMELGATRNFENWADADPSGKRVGAMPTAEADDDYDSEGNPLEDKAERDAMADLERTQEQSRREMEMMDELAELRQRNARVETRDVDHDDLLAQLHVERITAAEEEAKRREEEEDDAEVAKHFAKFRAGGVNAAAGGSGAGKANGAGLRALNGQGEADGSDAEDEDEADAEREAKEKEAAALTIKRRPAPPPNGASNGAAGRAEPSVASILAAKGKTLDSATASGAAHAGAKRKREGMQKLLGIKKKA